MGRYITQTDIEDVFGTVNVAVWSNLDNDTTTADTARINRMIDLAESRVDDRFRNGPYLLPLSGASLPTVKDWCARLAGALMYRARGNRDHEGTVNDVLAHIVTVNQEIDAYLIGGRRLDCGRVVDSTSAPEVWH